MAGGCSDSSLSETLGARASDKVPAASPEGALSAGSGKDSPEMALPSRRRPAENASHHSHEEVFIMQEKINRRTALAAAAAAGLAGASGVSARPLSGDAALERIEARMTTLEGRAPSLNPRQKVAALFAAAVAAGSPAPFYALTRSALRAGVTATEVKEILYQTAPYAGLSRVAAALPEVNRAFGDAGVAATDQTTVTDATRLTKGIEVQTAIFGEAISRMHAGAAPEERVLLIDDLSGWCFGDFYTRTGLSIADRELVTFITIAGLGGCEAQLKAHAAANAKEGATRAALIDALQAALPYLGFPRTLNALAVVKEVVKA